MTVAELIAALKELPQDLLVAFDDRIPYRIPLIQSGPYEIQTVELLDDRVELTP